MLLLLHSLRVPMSFSIPWSESTKNFWGKMPIIFRWVRNRLFSVKISIIFRYSEMSGIFCWGKMQVLFCCGQMPHCFNSCVWHQRFLSDYLNQWFNSNINQLILKRWDWGSWEFYYSVCEWVFRFSKREGNKSLEIYWWIKYNQWNCWLHKSF